MPAQPTDTPPSRRSNRLFALLALLLSAAHFASFFDPERSIATDIRYFLYFAWRIAEGAVPHLDLFDNKTFLASFAGALFYRVGSWLGVEPLHAIRVACLAISALGGAFVFAVFRRLAGGSQVAGFLGLLAHLAFPFLAAVPAIGNFPKLIMGAAAPAMVLLVHDRRWFAAGLLGAIAFMDWQIGALVWLGAFVGALTHGAGRSAAALRVVAGGFAGMVPFLVYYAAHGALAIAFQQTIVASFFRGSTSLGGTTLASRIDRISGWVGDACPQHEWLFALGLACTLLAPALLWRWRGSEGWKLVPPLCVYHYGVVAFSLVDFQALLDLFVLIQTLAFFLGVTWVAIYAATRQRLLSEAPPLRRAVVAAGALLLAVAVARPGPLHQPIAVHTRRVKEDVTLSEQRIVAEKVREHVGTRRLVLLGASELLFLMRYVNPIPLVYFNAAPYHFYAKPGQETLAEARVRVLLEAEPDAFILDRRVRPTEAPLDRFTLTLIRSGTGSYEINLYSRN
jgi:hypothetical protein